MWLLPVLLLFWIVAAWNWHVLRRRNRATLAWVYLVAVSLCCLAILVANAIQ
jgi:hypothetical protein